MRSAVPSYEPDVQREDEIIREERWASVVAWIRAQHCGLTWGEIVESASEWMKAREFDGPDAEPDDKHGRELVDFAETEGWDGVLTAIARAMREEDAARRELCDRR